MTKIDSGVARCDRRLWCAVIIQAATDMDMRVPKVKPSPSNPNRNADKLTENIEEIRKDARDWFLSTDKSVGAFGWICDTLDLDYHKIQSLSMTREGRRILTGDDNRKKQAVEDIGEDI